MSVKLFRTWIKTLAEKFLGSGSHRLRTGVASGCTGKKGRPRLETLEERITPTSWNQFNGNAQHTGISTVAAQPMDQILWQTSLDLAGRATFGTRGSRSSRPTTRSSFPSW